MTVREPGAAVVPAAGREKVGGSDPVAVPARSRRGRLRTGFAGSSGRWVAPLKSSVGWSAGEDRRSRVRGACGRRRTANSRTRARRPSTPSRGTSTGRHRRTINVVTARSPRYRLRTTRCESVQARRAGQSAHLAAADGGREAVPQKLNAPELRRRCEARSFEEGKPVPERWRRVAASGRLDTYRLVLSAPRPSGSPIARTLASLQV